MNSRLIDESALASSAPTSALPRKRTEFASECAALLSEIHQMLEDYAPVWYTEQLHERTERLLNTLRIN